MGERARLAAKECFDIRVLAARFDALVDEAADVPDGPDPADAAAVAHLWARVLPALELLGESTPGELYGLLLEWLGDLGARAVLHRTEDINGLGLTPATGVVSCVADSRSAGVQPGSLVITAAPDEAGRLWGDKVYLLPLVMPRVLNFASRRVLAALGELKGLGFSRVALYGAGKHTRKVEAGLERVPTGVSVVGIVDDRAGQPGGPGARICGLPVVTPAEAHSLAFDAVIVSSDEHERVMWPRAREWAGDRPVIALYAPIERPGGEIPEALIATSPLV
jgi:hypothetical protein